MIVKRFLFLLLVMGFAAAPVLAGESLPPLARQALHKAQVRMDAKQYAEAAGVLREYMAQPEETVPYQVYLLLGSALHRNDDAKRALDVFQAGRKAYPDSDLLARNCAVVCYELERYAEAGRLFEKAYALKVPKESSLLFHAGSAYYVGEDFASAARVLGSLLDQEPQPREDWVRLAVHAHLEAGLPDKTEAILRRYLAANPGEAPYWELLAKLHLDREEYENAAGALEICYRLREPSAKELERLASLYAYANAPLMASATLQRVRPDEAGAEYGIRIAKLYASAGRPEEAVRQLSRFGRSAALAERKGRILYDARRFQEAEREFREALGQDKDAAESRYFLGMCAWERRDWETAKASLLKLLGDKRFSRRVKAPLAVIDDLESARREGRD